MSAGGRGGGEHGGSGTHGAGGGNGAGAKGSGGDKGGGFNPQQMYGGLMTTHLFNPQQTQLMGMGGGAPTPTPMPVPGYQQMMVQPHQLSVIPGYGVNVPGYGYPGPQQMQAPQSPTLPGGKPNILPGQGNPATANGMLQPGLMMRRPVGY